MGQQIMEVLHGHMLKGKHYSVNIASATDVTGGRTLVRLNVSACMVCCSDGGEAGRAGVESRLVHRSV